MPGILYHLAFSEEVYRKCSKLNLDKINFMAGNLIPDLASNKNLAHHTKDASVKGFTVPNIEVIRKELFVPEDSIKFGMFCHLYLDYFFIEDFLIPEFIWDADAEKVINPRNGKQWTFKDFFSSKGMYGSYTEINTLMLRDGRICMETIDSIPTILPLTGIPVFDDRRKKTWRQELEEYFLEKKVYTGDVFDYNRLWNSIQKIANQFVEELS